MGDQVVSCGGFDGQAVYAMEKTCFKYFPQVKYYKLYSILSYTEEKLFKNDFIISKSKNLLLIQNDSWVQIESLMSDRFAAAGGMLNDNLWWITGMTMFFIDLEVGH